MQALTLVWFSLAETNIALPSTPVDLLVELLPGHVVVDTQRPRFSWRTGGASDGRGEGIISKAYQIQVSQTNDFSSQTHLVWDSRRVDSNDTALVEFAGETLQSDTTYHWRVRWWADASPSATPSAWSSGGSFDTALLSQKDWNGAAFMRCAVERNCGYLRSDFVLPDDDAVVRARAFVAAMGWIEPHVNGQKIDNDNVLEPGWSQWDARMLYSVHDVTHLLRSGRQSRRQTQPRNDDCAADISGGGWKLVRHVPAGIHWHKATDKLSGTEEYGDAAGGALAKEPWSLRFDGKDFNEFLFATGDCQKWLVAKKSEVLDWYSDQPRQILKSSTNDQQYSARWYRRHGHAEDPWVSLEDHTAAIGNGNIVYGENLFGGAHAAKILPVHQGANVYIRKGAIPPPPPCVTSDALGGKVNTIGIVLGNGWPGHLGHSVAGKFFLRVTLRSGRVIIHGNQPKNWCGSPGPHQEDDIYNGETYDARREIPGWDLPGVDSEHWESVVSIDDETLRTSVMSLQLMRPIRGFHLIDPIATWQPTPDTWVADFGQNIAGWTRLQLPAGICTRGQSVTMRHAEYVSPDGTINQGNLRTAKATDVYICSGFAEPVAYEPKFTYHGFRYVQVTGLTRVTRLEGIVAARVVHSDVSFRGHTSHTVGSFLAGGEAAVMVNALMRACEWTQRDNLHSVATDCPQRDERQGWMADASVSSEGAIHYFWMHSFYSNWLRTMDDVQNVYEFEKDCKAGAWQDCNGTVADTVPHMPGLFGNRPADPSWGVARLIIYENTVNYYGDLGLAQHLYESSRRFVDWHLRAADVDASRVGLVTYHYYGDWLQPGRVASKEQISQMASSFNFLLGLRIMRDVASLLGKTQDSEHFNDELKRRRGSFHWHYFNRTTGTYADGSQAALVFALYIEAPPNATVRQQTFMQLLKAISDAGDHVSTGILSTKWLMELLSSYGRSDVAMKLLLQTEDPSWGFMLANNATTIWEHWNAIHNPSGNSMNSRNHPAFSSVGAWMYRWLGGLRLDGYGQGYRDVLIAPALVDHPGISSCSVSVMTSYGAISAAWLFEAGIKQLRINATFPDNTRGRVVPPTVAGASPFLIRRSDGKSSEVMWSYSALFPTAEVKVGSGTFEFVIEYRDETLELFHV
eukprot:TRINITY_DN24650_c0_g2_i1.p1 TRINITY_DN24650_c0_g2~~TRINITY_DN24650_c0_g2_i1.p1  ORF type:complete len:1139 (+),score=129.46 TRINITY_DN24650_c0_g2_i1:60-3476(+)